MFRASRLILAAAQGCWMREIIRRFTTGFMEAFPELGGSNTIPNRPLRPSRRACDS
jgi:hypothetical protein